MADQKIYLEIRKRSDDYHVQLKDHPEIWACGKTEGEAIEDWKRTHRMEGEVKVIAEPKYKVGDTVYFVNGSFGEHECKVTEVHTGHQGLTGFFPFSEPVYKIVWRPTGGAIAHEHELTSEPRSAALAASQESM